VNYGKYLMENSLQIKPYTPELEPLVKEFNVRLRQGGETYWAFPESHVPRLPKVANENPYQEFFLTCDGGAVRGGYLLTHSEFVVRGETTRIACGPQLNMSEALVNRCYGIIGALNVRDAVKRQPLLYGLGMGGFEQPQTKILSSMRWPLRAVPFFFKVLNAPRFLANINYLRETGGGRLMLDLGRYTGLGSMAAKVVQFRPGNRNGATAELCHEFDDWADENWARCKRRYRLVAVRNKETLNRLYPCKDSRFLRLRVSRGGRLLGWAVLLDTQMSGHKQFGHMRVGSIVDCLAEPEDASAIVQSSSTLLERRGVDLIVSNQTSSAWCRAFIASGFVRGPTNFIQALSPALASRLEPLPESWGEMHLNRGDGDGPIHL